MSTSERTTKHMRLLTYNLWHGLNHTMPLLLPPVEAPWKSWIRRLAQMRGLQELLLKEDLRLNHPCLEVFCLQEMNPVRKRAEYLRNHLNMQGAAMSVNSGVALGRLSYPPFLDEGLGTFWRGMTSKLKIEEKILSGNVKRGTTLGGIRTSFQISEARGAQLVHFEWENRLWTFVNMHLHHGVLKIESRNRRSAEVDNLVKFIEPYMAISDATFLLGDFNCEHSDSSFAPLKALGFQEFLRADGSAIHSWDASQNPLCRESIALDSDPATVKYLSEPKQFDHVFYKARGKAWGKRDDTRAPWKVTTTKVFAGPHAQGWLSDHLGILVDITWTD